MTTLLEQSQKFGKQRLAFINAVDKGEAKYSDWKESETKWNYEWGECWKSQVIYHVSDYASEVGFLIDILGLDCITLSDDYALMSTHDKQSTFGVRPVNNEREKTPASAISMEFMIKDIKTFTENLKAKNISLDEDLKQDMGMIITSFKTPAGITFRAWGEIESIQ